MIGNKLKRKDEKMENSSSYILKENVSYGTVKIADDVVAMIAGLAATEVEGVAQMAGNVGNEILSSFGVKNTSKGVRVEITGKEVKVYLAIVAAYGYNIPLISNKVQDKVKQAVESMTGLKVTDVNLRVAGINVAGNK